MNARAGHLDPLPENLLGVAHVRREWNTVTFDLTEFHCDGRVVHQLSNDNDARLSVVVEEIGAHGALCEPRLHPAVACPLPYVPGHMLYAPPEMAIWGFCADARYVKDATLTFDMAKLSERLEMRFAPARVSTPQLRLVDEPVRTLVKLLTDTAHDSDASASLFGESITTAIATRLFLHMPEPKTSAKALAPWQLRRVTEYMTAHLPAPVSLADLAKLSGLSQWHFSRAFKASTGLAPYRWQLQARIRRAQALLLDTRSSLEQIAEATGFSDAVHFGKVFRNLVGITPAAWRRVRRR